jgi:hypothetical protein
MYTKAVLKQTEAGSPRGICKQNVRMMGHRLYHGKLKLHVVWSWVSNCSVKTYMTRRLIQMIFHYNPTHVGPSTQSAVQSRGGRFPSVMVSQFCITTTSLRWA